MRFCCCTHPLQSLHSHPSPKPNKQPNLNMFWRCFHCYARNSTLEQLVWLESLDPKYCVCATNQKIFEKKKRMLKMKVVTPTINLQIFINFQDCLLGGASHLVNGLYPNIFMYIYKFLLLSCYIYNISPLIYRIIGGTHELAPQKAFPFLGKTAATWRARLCHRAGEFLPMDTLEKHLTIPHTNNIENYR
jgi:hypothetical protein